MNFKYKNNGKEIEFKISYSTILLIGFLISRSPILLNLISNTYK